VNPRLAEVNRGLAGVLAFFVEFILVPLCWSDSEATIVWLLGNSVLVLLLGNSLKDTVSMPGLNDPFEGISIVV
jgi:hypothetical protein